LAAILIHRTRLNRESQMPPYANLRPTVGPHYRIANLVEKRRDVLRLARSLPRGPKRNQLRQTAASLRTLLRNKGWLDALHGRLMAEFPEQ
jgi:hypothetical protein